MLEKAPKPWQDCPPCPACTAPCGSRVGEAVPPGHVRCACCGHDWLALPGEVAQALAADRAWEDALDPGARTVIQPTPKAPE